MTDNNSIVFTTTTTTQRKKSVYFENENDDSGSRRGSTISTTSEDYRSVKQRRTGSVFLQFGDLTEEDKNEMKMIFDLFDLDEDGVLNKDELTQMYKTLNVNKNHEFSALSFITNATGNKRSDSVNFVQFTNYFAGSYFGKFSSFELIYAFRLFDTRKKGYIDRNDLLELFDKLNWNDKINVDEILNDMDYNKDGKVCFQDFQRMMSNGTNLIY